MSQDILLELSVIGYSVKALQCSPVLLEIGWNLEGGLKARNGLEGECEIPH